MIDVYDFLLSIATLPAFLIVVTDSSDTKTQ